MKKNTHTRRKDAGTRPASRVAFGTGLGIHPARGRRGGSVESRPRPERIPLSDGAAGNKTSHGHTSGPIPPAGHASDPLAKRLANLLLALVGLLLTTPLFIVLPLLIKLTSPGPVFYRQVRTGLYGRPFTMWKFRSMVVDAEREGRALWSMEHDPRVTRIGAVMRGGRLDELPQLFNILRGDMNLVGPRPERPEFVEMLERTIPEYHNRHLVKPGLTGWAQVRFRYAASVEETKTKVAYDLEYINRRSFALDCLIIVQTVGVVLRGVASLTTPAD